MPDNNKPAPVRGNFPIIPVTQAPNPRLDYFYDAAYDKGYRPEMNQEYNRSANQSWYKQLGLGLMSRGLSIGTKFAAGLGSVGVGLTVPFSENTVDDIWNNTFTMWANNLDESLNDVFPVYKSQAYAEGDLLQKLMTTSFWATDGFDGLAFAASAYVPGGFLGKLGSAGAKVVQSGKLSSTTLKGLQAIGITAENVGTVAQNANLLLATAYNTVAESAAEAHQTQKEVEAIYLSKGFSPEVAKQKAAEAARETFGANAAVLAVPNLIQNMMFHGSWGSKVAGVRAAAIESKGAATTQGLIESRLSQVGTGFLSEGLWEENAQTAIQQYERNLARGFTDHGAFEEITDNLWSNMKGFAKSILPGEYDITADEAEGALSIALGGILGGAFGLNAHRMESANVRELVETENKSYASFVKDVLPAASTVLKENVTSILKQNGTIKVPFGDKKVEIPNYEVDENGNWQHDDKAVMNLVTNSLRSQVFWDLELVAAVNNNQTLGELNKEMGLLSAAFELATKKNQYSKQDLLNILKANTEIGDAEAKKLGIDTLIHENMDTIAKYIDAIEATNNKYQTAKAVSNPAEYGFKSFLRNTDLYLQGKINAINKIRTKHENMTPKLSEQLNILEADTLVYREFLKDEKQIRDIYDTFVDRPAKYESEKRKLQEKKDKTQEDYDKIRELSYLLAEEAYINGTFAWQGTGARGNPIGLNSLALSQTTRGSMDDHNMQIGNSWIALRRAQQALNQENPEWNKAEAAFAEINTQQDPDLLADTAGRIVTNLNEQVAQGQEIIDRINDFRKIQQEVGNLEPSEAEGQTWGELLSPEAIAALKIDPSVQFNEDDFFEIEGALLKEGEAVYAQEEAINQQLINLQSKIDFISSYQDRIDAANSKYTKFLQTPNKEAFLKKDFYVNTIQVPTEAFIDNARKYSTLIMDLTKLNNLVNQLKGLIQAYINRQDGNNPTDVVPDAEKLLDILEQEIRPIILKNLNNQVAHQISSNENSAGAVLAALQANDALKQLLKTVLGTDDYKETLKTETGISYDGVEVILQQIRSKATKEQKQELEKLLLEQKSKLLTQIYDTIPEARRKGNEGELGVYLTKGQKHYGAAPSNRIVNLFRILYEKELENIEESELMQKFMMDYDFATFVLSLDNTKLSDPDKTFITALFKLHNQVIGVNKVLSHLTDSTLDTTALIAIKEELQLEINPSLQQNIVIDDILNFLSTKITPYQFNNWFLVNGIGGSGKTFLVASVVNKMWTKLAKQSQESVIAFSRQDKTSKNIQKAVFGKEGTLTYEGFLQMTDAQLDKVETIIVDEAFTFTNPELASINQRISKYNEARKAANKEIRGIHIIALGDSSQVTAEKQSLLQDVQFPKIGTTIPLTTTFRTNVDSISTFAAEFRMRTIPVTNVSAQANKPISEILASPSTSLGVASMSEEQIFQALNMPSSRSRVLIVPLEADVATYKSQFPTLDIRTPGQAQGYQWDEVYAIVNPRIYANALETNKALYTTFSRAKAFLAISGLELSNSLPLADMEAKLTSEDELLGKMTILYDQNLKGARKTIEKFEGVPTLTKEDLEVKAPPVVEEDEQIPVAPEDEQVTSPPIEPPAEPDDIIAGEPITYDPANAFLHTLEYPKNTSLAPIQVEVTPGNFQYHSPVAIGSEGHIIRTKRKDKDFYYVIGRHQNGNWVVLGALGDTDFKKSPQLSDLILKSTGSIEATQVNESAPFPLSESQIQASSVSPITVQATQRFRTNYGPVFRSNSSPDLKGIDIIEDTIITFYNSYYSWTEGTENRRMYPAEVYNSAGDVYHVEKDWVVNGKVNWDVLKDKVELRIMTKKHRTEAGLDKLMDGVPYLVIKDAKQKGAKVDSITKAIYIQMQPTQIAKDHPYIETIRELTSAITAIESILGPDYALGTTKLEQTIDAYARANFLIDNNTSSGDLVRSLVVSPTAQSVAESLGLTLDPEQSKDLDQAFQQAIILSYGIKKQLKTFKSEKEARDYLAANGTQDADGNWTLTSPDVSKDTGQPKTFLIVDVVPQFEGSKNWVLKYASSLEDTSKTKNYQEYGIRRGEGIAQHKLNALAMANKFVSGIRIRTVTNIPEGGKLPRLTRSKSIFGTEKAFDLEGFLSDSRVVDAGWYKDSYRKDVKTTATTQALDFLISKIGKKEAWAIVQQYTIEPFDLLTLRAISDESQFGDDGHISLRTPLHLSTHNSTGVNDIGTSDSVIRPNYRLHIPEVRATLAENLTSSFTGMSRTSVSIVVGKTTPVARPKPVPSKITIAEAFKSIKDTSPVAQLLREIKSIQDVEVLFQPSVFDNNKEVSLTEVAATHTDSAYKKGIAILTGLSKKDLLAGTKESAELLLHEFLHVASMQALAKGKEDLAKGTDTKEALLYTRLTELQTIFDAHLAKKKISKKKIYAPTKSKLDVFEFVANLSHPPFREEASKVLVKDESLLTKIFKAILDYFKGTTNVYDLTLESLRDFYAEAKTVPTSVTTPQLNAIITGLVADIKAKIVDIKDDELLDNLLAGIFNVSQFKKDQSLEFTKPFAKKGEATQIDILTNLYNILLSRDNNIQFAIYNRPKSALLSTPGAAVNTAHLENAIEKYLPEIWPALSKHEQNLLYTLLNTQLLAPGTKFLDNLIYFVNNNDRSSVVSNLWNDILSNKDRSEFKSGLELETDADAINYMLETYDTDPIVQMLVGIVAVIEVEKTNVENIVGSLEERTPYIYKAAKEYVLQIIRDNQRLKSSTDKLMLTRYSLYIDLLAKVKDINTDQLLEDLQTAYTKLDELRKANQFTDEYFKLLHDTIPTLQNRYIGITSLQSRNIHTGNLFVDDIYREIYPKDPLDKVEATEIASDIADLEDAVGSVDDELKEAVNIAEYMIHDYKKSYELTLSESMKDYLATASITFSDGTQKHLSPAVMYVKMLQITATLEFGATDDLTASAHLLHQVKARLATELSPLDATVYSTFRDVLNSVLHFPEETPKSISIVTGATPGGNIWYAAARSTTGEDISNLTYEQLRLKPNVSLTSQLNDTPNLSQQFKRLYPELNIFQFNSLLHRAESINILKGIQNTMASMRETDLYIGMRSYQGGLTNKMQRSKASGITFNIKETIKQALIDKFSEGKFFSAIQNFNNNRSGGKQNSVVPQSGTAAQKLEYIKQFYQDIAGLPHINVGATIASDASGKLQDYVSKIAALLAAASNLSTKNVHIANEILADESQYLEDQEDILDDSFTSFINDIDGYLTVLSEYASLSSEYLRNPSVRTLRGDRYYKWHESSFAFDTLAAITDLPQMAVLNAGTGSNRARKLPTHLYASFYNNNIFVRGAVKNRIHSIGEWEGHLNEDNDSPTEYLRENFNFYYQKKFAQGFLDGLRQYRNSYFQYVYTPADKPKHPLVRINLLADDRVTKSIRLALSQILESSAYHLHIKNYNKSHVEDLFRNFTIGKGAIDELKIPFTVENLDAITAKAVEILERRASTELDNLLSADVEFRLDTSYAKLMRSDIMKDAVNPKYKGTIYPTTDSGNFNLTRKEGYQENKELIKATIIPAFELWYKNNYINGYFLNQLTSGDYAAFGSSTDQVKRSGGVYAPGIRGWVDEITGMKEHYKVLVLQDTHVEKATTEQRLKTLFFGDKTDKQISPKDLAEFERVMKFFSDKGYDMTDAQGFMTPARFVELGRGFERAWYRGAVHKPVHYEVQQIKVRDAENNPLLKDGKPVTTAIGRYTKYSSIVLSDEMLDASKSDLLRELRNKLERLEVDEVLFNSGVKQGAPLLLDDTGTPLFTDDEGKHRWMTFEDVLALDDAMISKIKALDSFMNDDNFKGSSGILTLSNRHFRLQHNPATGTDKSIAIYSQLMYFLNVFSNPSTSGVGLHPSLQAHADKIYGLVGELIALGREEFSKSIDSPAAFRSFLRKKFAETPNGERVAELLEAEIGLDNPLIEQKAIIALASGMEKATVRVKFSGAKLILQTSEGMRVKDPTATVPERELQYVVDTINNRRVMVAEVFVPEAMLTNEMRAAMAKGESVFLYGDAMGFRIPSTELHSAVPLKIVGVYSPGERANVIIAPKELVPIHGSDFDVDSLFVIMRETYSESETAVISAAKVIEYQRILKQLFDNLRKENELELLEGIKLKLGLDKDEPITNFTSQSTLEERYTEYVSEENWDPILQQSISRLDRDDYNEKELQYKNEWGKLHGYKLKKDPATGKLRWEVHNRLLASMSELHYLLPEFPANLTSNLPTKSILEDFSRDLLGTIDAPVGYIKKDDRYVLDETYLPKLKAQLQSLEDLKDSLHINVKALVLPAVKSSIGNLRSLIQKAIKNNITETMLSIITNIDENGSRMVTPINFEPLEKAIAKQIKVPHPDLSDAAQEYRVFYSLSSGAILTGAFANAVKDFAYLTQAGDSPTTAVENQKLVELTKAKKDAEQQIELLKVKKETGLTDEELSTLDSLRKTVSTLEKDIKKLRTQIALIRGTNKGSFRAQINSSYHYSIGDFQYNSLETRDKNKEYNITEIFDTLINAAIDNLKLGLLGQAKINTQTGSAVVGGTFLGTPLSTIVDILNQPILYPLTTGISDKKETYIASIIEKYPDLYAEAEASIHPSELTKGKILSNNPEDWSTQDLKAQLRILKIFSNMNKIGEDARNLSSFLGLIQNMKVTVEALDGLDNLISSKIGTINDVGILTPKADFAFIAPNLLANTPHVLEAYKTHKAIQEFVSKYFTLHSPEIRAFAETVNSGLKLRTDETVSNAAENQAEIRKAFSHYLLMEIPWKEVEKTKSVILKFKGDGGREIKMGLSIARSYMYNVANQLKAIKEFATKQNIINSFLDNVYIGSDRTGAPLIQFRGGVNMHSEDHQQIRMDFRKLNMFHVDEHNNVSYSTDTTPYSKTPFQEALVNYAIIAYGLSYGASNYSMYIPASFIKEIDEQYTQRLKDFQKKIADSKITNENAELQYFKLSYVAQAASRLPFANYKNVAVVETRGKQKLKNGKEEKVLTKDGLKTVFFDMKVKRTSDKDTPSWIKEGSKNRLVAYRKVAESTDATYYQKIGKIKDLFYTPLQQDHYTIKAYYDPSVYTISYLIRENNTINSPTAIDHFINVGDVVYIAPNYDFGRTERQLVRITKMEKLTEGKYPGYTYSFEFVEESKMVESAEVLARTYSWARTSSNGYEVSSRGDSRFSALNATLQDGRTIEEAYQLDVKGYRAQGNNWRLGKGKPPLISMTQEQSWEAYKSLWEQWANENPELIRELAKKAEGKVLTDQFANTAISQARALAEILNAREQEFEQKVKDLGIQKVCE